MTLPVISRSMTVLAAAQRTLDAGEARQYLEAPMTEAEREGILGLAAWFQRRYDTPAARLAYVRRAYARWQRTRGVANQI